MTSLINIKSPNCLNFYGFRQREIPPPYFNYTFIKQRAFNLKSTYTKWIMNNLKGRFYIGETQEINSDGKHSKIIKVGFEDPTELTFFILACPYVNNR